MIGGELWLKLCLGIQNSLAPPDGGRVAHQTDRALEGRVPDQRSVMYVLIEPATH